MMFYKHRIVPGHVGGTYDPKNVVRVNLAMHAFLHKCLFDQHGRWQDKVAWQVLSGAITREAGILEVVRNAGRFPKSAEHRAKIGAANRGNKRPDFAARLRARRGVRLSAEHRAKIAAAGMGRTSPNKGKTLNAEWRGKIGASLLGQSRKYFRQEEDGLLLLENGGRLALENKPRNCAAA